MTKNFHLNAFDIFLVSETTINSFFQNSQFRLGTIEIALEEAYACLSMKKFL